MSWSVVVLVAVLAAETLGCVCLPTRWGWMCAGLSVVTFGALLAVTGHSVVFVVGNLLAIPAVYLFRRYVWPRQPWRLVRERETHS